MADLAHRAFAAGALEDAAANVRFDRDQRALATEVEVLQATPPPEVDLAGGPGLPAASRATTPPAMLATRPTASLPTIIDLMPPGCEGLGTRIDHGRTGRFSQLQTTVYAVCSMPSSSPTQECMRSSQTEKVGAGKLGSANAPTTHGALTRRQARIDASGGFAVQCKLKNAHEPARIDRWNVQSSGPASTPLTASISGFKPSR